MVELLHKQLKENGRQMLLQRGFDGADIKFEHKLNVNGKNYVVDVYAKKDGKDIVLECGSILNERKKLLEDFADEFIHLKYDKTATIQIEVSPELNTQLKVYCAEKELFVKEFITLLIEYFFNLKEIKHKKIERRVK